MINQNSIAGYESLELLEKLEEIKDKPLNYADFVGKSLIVKEFGYGFLESDIGRICKIVSIGGSKKVVDAGSQENYISHIKQMINGGRYE